MANHELWIQPVLDGVTLPLKSQVCSLGVRLDAQVSVVARSAFAVKAGMPVAPVPRDV